MAPLYPIAGIIVGLIQLGAGAWGGVWGAQVACDLEGSLSGLGAASCFVEQTPLPLPTDVASPISTVTRSVSPFAHTLLVLLIAELGNLPEEERRLLSKA